MSPGAVIIEGRALDLVARSTAEQARLAPSSGARVWTDSADSRVARPSSWARQGSRLTCQAIEQDALDTAIVAGSS